jgi:hypothetical protein
MNKKEDLKLVFEFIADFLRETVEEKVVSTPIVEPEPKMVEKPKSKMELLIESINPEDVRGLMQRVDEMDKPTFTSTPFEAEFNRMVSQVDKLTKEREENNKNNVLDAVSNSDFNIIKNLRNNVTLEERESVRPSYNTIGDILQRAKTGVSFSG